MSRSQRSRILRELEHRIRPFAGDSPDGDGCSEDEALRARIEQAREQGFREGVEHASAELNGLIEQAHRELSAAMRTLIATEEQREAELERILAELVVESASFVLRERIDNGDPVVQRVVRQTLACLPPRVELKLRLHPEDVDAVRPELERELASGRLSLQPDADIARGGCVADGSFGNVDATVDVAREALRSALRGDGEPVP